MQKILVVEDEPTLGKIYKNYLTQAGFAVELASTVEAVGELENFQPDLILLDHGLPEGEENGIESIPKLKKRFPETKIVLFSNYSAFELKDGALAAGADDYWVKVDLSLANLLGKIQKLIGS